MNHPTGLSACRVCVHGLRTSGALCDRYKTPQPTDPQRKPGGACGPEALQMVMPHEADRRRTPTRP